MMLKWNIYGQQLPPLQPLVLLDGWLTHWFIALYPNTMTVVVTVADCTAFVRVDPMEAE